MPNRHYYRLPGDDAPDLYTCGLIAVVAVIFLAAIIYILMRAGGLL